MQVPHEIPPEHQQLEAVQDLLATEGLAVQVVRISEMKVVDRWVGAFGRGCRLGWLGWLLPLRGLAVQVVRISEIKVVDRCVGAFGRGCQFGWLGWLLPLRGLQYRWCASQRLR